MLKWPQRDHPDLTVIHQDLRDFSRAECPKRSMRVLAGYLRRCAR